MAEAAALAGPYVETVEDVFTNFRNNFDQQPIVQPPSDALSNVDGNVANEIVYKLHEIRRLPLCSPLANQHKQPNTNEITPQ